MQPETMRIWLEDVAQKLNKSVLYVSLQEPFRNYQDKLAQGEMLLNGHATGKIKNKPRIRSFTARVMSLTSQATEDKIVNEMELNKGKWFTIDELVEKIGKCRSAIYTATIGAVNNGKIIIYCSHESSKKGKLRFYSLPGTFIPDELSI